MVSYYGIKFNGKHSWNDFGITMPPEKEIGMPEKQKILVRPPWSNMDLDFSDLYGTQVYENRKLTYSFNILHKTRNSKERMNFTKTVLINWLMNSNGKQRLYDDAIPGYYFLAEVVSDASFKENWDTGVLTVTFDAYPFMICDYPEGNDIWDTFNFDLDVSQNVNFTVTGSLGVSLINPGVPGVIPEIEASSNMEIAMGGVIYKISAGVTKNEAFMIKSGENDLTIRGNGTISFTFYKELI